MNLDFLKGKKTFIFIGLFGILAALTFIPSIVIPEWVFGILASLGLGFLRSAVKHLSGNSGIKTYAAAAAVFVMSILNALGVVLPYEIIYSILAAFGIVGVRDALAEIPTD